MRVTPREAEGHAAPLWPPVERFALGEWELRTDPAPVDRLRKRANSCLAMGEADRPFDAAVEAIRAFYTERDREALVQVLVGSAEEEAFLAAGWRLVVPGEAELRLASLATTRRVLPRGDDAEVVVTEDGPRVRAVVGHARGEAALDGSWLGVHGMVTDPSYRRQGLARRVLARARRVGCRAGCDHAVAARGDRQRAGHRVLRGSRAADPPRLPLLRGSVQSSASRTPPCRRGCRRRCASRCASPSRGPGGGTRG